MHKTNNTNQHAHREKKQRPLKGYLIAGASLAALFGMVYLKARVK